VRRKFVLDARRVFHLLAQELGETKTTRKRRRAATKTTR